MAHEILDHPDLGALDVTAVLDALGNPLRLEAVRQIAAGVDLTCGSVLPGVSKSTASHHWRVLRQAGVLHQERVGRTVIMSLRRKELDARFPGLLDAVLSTTGPTPLPSHLP
ncbi:transcriptional regulator, ArsR family [Sanguibacter gelidistatuariae]|uniref:Transcriptional regulator, ArsR family n=1 Tax=Sanguibacter gelidistatuariae TaxID=1814289 RepID=A0A1G6K3I5_9MICO|nr:helix-turn-helix transcriptional regulator [Sanguibacter gelidistatuariae]SDC25195.1 transcriptional regulator, ArsR family [Sanguibacter gelidistatuariae]